MPTALSERLQDPECAPEAVIVMLVTVMNALM
jgi:hypothetical protein